MKAFITGGTGFIGSHLVDTLIREDTYDELRCLIRSREKWLEGKSFTRIHGDLHDLSALRRAMEGVDIVYHLAGVVKAPTQKEFDYANVEATENLIRTAQKSGVKKIVVLSSLAAAGPSFDEPVAEDDPMMPISMYGRSKKKMEERIREIAEEDDSITILRPPSVYGPREDQIYMFFKMASKGFCPVINADPPPQLSMVFVDDVVQGLLLAGQQKEPGINTYYISEENFYSWDDIRAITGRVLGRRITPVKLRPEWVKSIAGAIETVAGLTGIYPVINKEKANEMVMNWTCSIKKAQKELNFEPAYSLEEGIARTLSWYKKHHWL